MEKRVNNSVRPYVLQLMAQRGLDLSEVEDWVIETQPEGHQEVTVALRNGHLESWEVTEGHTLRINLGFADGFREMYIPPVAVRMAVA